MSENNLIYRVIKQRNGKFTIVSYLKLGETVQEFYKASNFTEEDVKKFFIGKQTYEHDKFFTESDWGGTWN